MLVLDMDGVLVNFCKAAFEAHNMPYQEGIVPNKFDFFEEWGMSTAEFWKPIDDKGIEFWANLEKYPWTDAILGVAHSWPTGFIIATSCSLHHFSCGGKVQSIKALLGEDFRDYALIPRKWYLAQQGYVLLDDNEDNCNEWESRYGKAVLFPQPWNKNRYLANNDLRMEWVLESLAAALLEDQYASV